MSVLGVWCHMSVLGVSYVICNKLNPEGVFYGLCEMFVQILALMTYVFCTTEKPVKVCLTGFFDGCCVLCHRFILSMLDVFHFPLGFYTHMQINA